MTPIEAFAAETLMLLSCCINVPERVNVAPAPFEIESRADMRAWMEWDYTTHEWHLFVTDKGLKLKGEARAFVAAHELLHATRADETRRWGTLSEKERDAAHKQINIQATKVVFQRRTWIREEQKRRKAEEKQKNPAAAKGKRKTWLVLLLVLL